MMDIKPILAQLKEALRELYGSRLVKLVLFGSYARDEAVEGSDIDVLVVLQDEVSPAVEIKRTGRIVADLSLDYDTVISCLFMPEQRYLVEKSPLLLNVRREGVTL